MTTKTMPNVGDNIYTIDVSAVPHANNQTCKVKRVESNNTVFCEFPAYVKDETAYPATEWFVSDWIAIGDKVVATDIPGYEHMSGQTVTVTSIEREGLGRPYFQASGFKNPDYPNSDPMDLAFYTAVKIEAEPVEKPTEGDTVRYVKGEFPDYVGEIGIVTVDDESDLPLCVSFEKIDRTVWVKYEDVEKVALVGPTTTPEPEPDLESLRAQVASLTVERDRWQRRAETAESTVRDAHRGFEIVGNRLNTEAENRGWCDEFDRIIDEVNSELPGVFELPIRETEYEVEVIVSGYMTTATTVSVTARSQSDADTIVSENMGDFVDADDVLTDAARHNSFDNIECEVE